MALARIRSGDVMAETGAYDCTAPPDMRRLCADGQPDAAWSCYFCRVSLHHPDMGCGCSERRPLTRYAPLCRPCAGAVDVLTADTVVGRAHRVLVHKASCDGRPSGDD